MVTTVKEEEVFEISRKGHITVHTIKVIYEDGVEVGKTSAPMTITHVPGVDVATRSDKVKALAAHVWTPEVVQAHVDRIAAIRTADIAAGRHPNA